MSSGVWLLVFFSGACSGEEPAVLVVDRALLGCLAGEFGAFEAEADLLAVGAGGEKEMLPMGGLSRWFCFD